MPPRPKKPSQKTAAPQSNLLTALKFLSVVTKEVGAVNETHCLLNGTYAVASNGVLSAGHLLDSEISASPNVSLLTQAVSKCGLSYAITIIGERISIKSEKFKASVPCIDPSVLFNPVPDNPIVAIDDRFKIALETVGVLTNDNGQHIYNASILIKGQSAYGTNGIIIFEYWHGLELPTIVVPKAFAQALSKISKPLKMVGGSPTSLTVYYEDGSWLKTQTFAEEWPIENLERILNSPSNPFPLPKDFYVGLEAVLPFSDDGLVWFDKDLIKSGDAENAATYEITGLTKGVKASGKQLLLIKEHVNSVDWFCGDHIAFFGPSVRGVIAGRR